MLDILRFCCIFAKQGSRYDALAHQRKTWLAEHWAWLQEGFDPEYDLGNSKVYLKLAGHRLTIIAIHRIKEQEAFPTYYTQGSVYYRIFRHYARICDGHVFSNKRQLQIRFTEVGLGLVVSTAKTGRCFLCRHDRSDRAWWRRLTDHRTMFEVIDSRRFALSHPRGTYPHFPFHISSPVRFCGI